MKKNKIHLTFNEVKNITLNLGYVCNVMVEKGKEIEVHINKGKLIFVPAKDQNNEYGWKCKSHIIVII